MTTLTDTHVTRAFAPALRDTGLPAGVIGQVTGIAVVYDVLDSYDTTFAPGSLDRTRREKVAAGKVKLFWDHGDAPTNDGMYDTDLHIGTVKSLEDVTLPDGKRAALMVADIFDTEQGRAAKQYLEAVLASGGDTGLSVGFRPRAETKLKGGVLRYDEIELREISVTAMQAVPEAEVSGVRASSGACAAHLRDAIALHDTLHPETGSMKPSVATHDQMGGMLTRALAALRPKKKVVGTEIPVVPVTVPGIGIIGQADTTVATLVTTMGTALTDGTIVGLQWVDEDQRAAGADPMAVAIEKLRAAIAIHTGHMDDPGPPSDASESEEMALLQAALAALMQDQAEDVRDTMEGPKAPPSVDAAAPTRADLVTLAETIEVSNVVQDATIQLQVRDRPSLEAALDVLLRALPLEIVRAHVDPVLGNATTDDSNADGPTPSDRNAEAEDSRAADLTAFATMEDRIRALRHSYAEAA